ncbi:MAG TPA: choice-of-anchor tandem repeat GloVer-containing protein [Rhizomicrobium sp.]|nr:choice-of-anchor tandem repeat GloVer-containing protein [Rhizomicrobium sp.]
MRTWISVAVGLTIAPLATAHTAAYKMTTIYSFCASANCADGRIPGALVRGARGDLYGATTGGGAQSDGVIFRLTPVKGRWRQNVLYSFCPRAGCADGFPASGKLVLDKNGNLYGVTLNGGKAGRGTVFKLSQNGSKWSLVVLHDFCSKPDCADGESASSPLTYPGAANGFLYDGVSPLYGSSVDNSGLGLIYALAPPQSGGRWKETIVARFRRPQDGIANDFELDASGSIFGATNEGGRRSKGSVFEIPATAPAARPKTLYSFCSAQDCRDGAYPREGVTVGVAGELLGVTENGGLRDAHCATTDGCGVIYRLSPGAPRAESVLYRFCAKADCADGETPVGDVLVNAVDDIFGVTTYGGGNDIDADARGGGTVYRFDGGLEKLYSFCARAACSDGAYPNAGLVTDSAGDLFGVTEVGGANDSGTVFELVPQRAGRSNRTGANPTKHPSPR